MGSPEGRKEERKNQSMEEEEEEEDEGKGRKRRKKECSGKENIELIHLRGILLGEKSKLNPDKTRRKVSEIRVL